MNSTIDYSLVWYRCSKCGHVYRGNEYGCHNATDECSNVSGTHSSPVQELFVNAYTVTQRYGGPEEGGWWYNHREPVCSVPVHSLSSAHCLSAFLKREYGRDKQGRYPGEILGYVGPNPLDSVDDIEPNDTTGLIEGYDTAVCIEPWPGKPTERPQYE